jgi:predicted phage terminase large subunit-like protein
VIKRYSPEIAGLLIRYKNRVFHESSDQYIRLLNNSKIAYTSVGSENRGMNIEGRPDLIVVDDILPDEARNSPSTRRNIEDRFLAVIDALGHENTSIFVFGTMIHPDDILSRLEKAGEYTVFKYPIIDENGNSNFIELYPPDRIERLRKHYETMGRLDIWNTEYMLTPVTPDETPFRNAITNFHSNLTIGDKHYAPLGLYRVMAIDHAQGIGGDDFAIVVTGHSPDDKVFLLEEFASNKVGIDGRLGKVIEMAIRYRPNLIVMERTAESLSFIQILRQTLRDRNLLFPFEEVTAKKLGAKNARIYSILSQYVKKLYFPLEGSKTVAELMGFNINKTDNRDDLIDALSLALMHTRKPSLVDTEQPMPSFLKGVQRAIKPAHDIVGQEWI